MIINGYSDKISDIVISLLLGLIPAYLFHLIYIPKYVLVEEKSMISDNKIIYNFSIYLYYKLKHVNF